MVFSLIFSLSENATFGFSLFIYFCFIEYSLKAKKIYTSRFSQLKAAHVDFLGHQKANLSFRTFVMLKQNENGMTDFTPFSLSFSRIKRCYYHLNMKGSQLAGSVQFCQLNIKDIQFFLIHY